MRSLAILFLILGFCFLSSPVKAEQERSPISASLVVDPVEEAQGSFLIGVKFKIKPGWHIYWKYPGESGLPTQVKVSGPTGSTLGEILWPTPVKFTQAGGLLGVGYEDEVVLLSRLIVPSAAMNNAITVQARWVGCSQKICVPGKAEFSFAAKDILKSSSVAVEDLGPWSDKTAKPLSDEVGKLIKSSTPGKVNNRVSNHELVFEWSKSAAQVDWLPVLPRNIKISNLKIESLGEKTVVNFQLERLDSEAENLKELEGEVIVSSSSGRRSYSHKFKL